jgi:rhodanese-related sulfurtransferase
LKKLAKKFIANIIGIFMFNKVWRGSLILLVLVALGSWAVLSFTSVGQREGEILGVSTLDLAQSQDRESSLSALEARLLIEEKANTGNLAIIDLRNPQDYNQGHIQNAVNIDYYRADFDEVIESLPKEVPYLIYSATSIQSSEVITKMQSMEFVEVYHLAGGILSWQAEGYQIIQTSNQKG